MTTEVESNIALIIGVALGSAALLTMIIIASLYCMRKRARIGEEIENTDSEDRHEKINMGPSTKENLSFGIFKEKE